MRLYGICLSLSELFHLAQCPRDSPILSKTAELLPFSRPSNIPLYVYHIRFIHSPTYGHLGCFQVVAMVNRGAMKMGCGRLFHVVCSIPLAT